jgi:hypothetical protein
MGDKTEKGGGGPRPVLELVPGGLKPPSAQKRRLFELPPPNADEAILYQHSVLCQTCLPFRDPGDDVRKWERANGLVNLLLAAGQAFHPDAAIHRCGVALRTQAALSAVSLERRGLAHAVAPD